MTAHSLCAHPTPTSGNLPDFFFLTKAEKDLYIQFETKLTGAEYSAYGAALTAKQRQATSEALMKKRKAVYKLWLERNKPVRGDVA